MKFTRKYEVDFYHSDYQKVLFPSFLGRYMHETAYNALYAFGPNPDVLLANSLAFVLSRISYRVFKPIMVKDVLEVTTWAAPPKGIAYNRFFEVTRDGERIAEAASVWGLFSLDTRSLVRPSDYADIVATQTDDDASVPIVGRWKAPDEMSILEQSPSYKVTFGDIDVNGHLNNVMYMDIIQNAIAPLTGNPAFKEQYVSGMDINYYIERGFGDCMSVCHGEADGAHFVRFAGAEDKPCAEARVVLSQL